VILKTEPTQVFFFVTHWVAFRLLSSVITLL